MKKQKAGPAAYLAVAVALLLLAVSILTGSSFLKWSQARMRELINNRMLDIANTSADLLDPEALKSISYGDENSPEFRSVYNTLRVFQDNIDLEFIYTLRDMGNGTFIFLVDPAEENASEFGQLATPTPALRMAATGTSAVDKKPYEDQWGRFYSAYSPVFDLDGRIAGIVAVDFRADWYDEQLADYSRLFVFFSLFVMLVGALAVFIVTAQMRRQLRSLRGKLSGLTQDLDKLTAELNADAKAAPAQAAIAEDADEADALGKRVHAAQEALRQFLDRSHLQTNGMLTALASDYRSLYYVDLDANEGVCYRSHTRIEDGLREGQRFPFFSTIRDYANRYVAESDRAEFLRIVTPENIRRELESESVVAHRYLVVRDGHESYEMLRMAGVRDPGDRAGRAIHAIGLGFTDVDRETRDSFVQKQALSDALAAAEDANRAKTVFLSGMSHEIRTPMNTIIGLDSIALSDPEITGKSRDYLEKIDASARHLLDLTNDLVDMSRIESGRMVLRNESFSFPHLLEQVNTIIAAQCREKGLTYESRADEALGGCFIGDPIKLKQMLINILSNAVKFTPADGSVTFLAERTAHSDGNSTLRFTVKDTGIGMDRDFLPKIFDAFSQEEPSSDKSGNAGLGLSITKNIVEMMNGKIDVESEKDVGSTFTVSVTLPDSDRGAGGAEADGRAHGLRVLAVDDYSLALEQTQLVLEQAGISCELARSGAEALELVRLHHARREPYDLILMDWKMPEMDGVEATRQIRALPGGDSPVIILTAYNWDEMPDEAVAAGVNSFAVKPLSAAGILEKFRRAQKKDGAAEQGDRVELAGRRLLLAEDIEINAEILREILSMRGLEADHAKNGVEAVELFSSHPAGFYAAILMDLRMPEMDGLEATAAIRSMDRSDAKTIPIIALTVNAFDEDVQHSLQAGLNAHLSKPVEPESLFATLESLIQ